MHKITAKLLNPNLAASKRIHALWHEYEEHKTKEAKFVKDLDRIEMALQGFEYERGVSCSDMLEVSHSGTSSSNATDEVPCAHATYHLTDQNAKTIQPFFESSIPKIRHHEVKAWAEEL